MKIFLLFLIAASSLLGANAVGITGPFSVTGAMQAASGSLGPPAKANNFSPADAATRVALNPTATWGNGGGATSYDVYGDTFSPPTTLRASSQSGTSYGFTVGYNATFYWRINPKNSFGTTTGDILSFASVPAYTADLFTGYEDGNNGDTVTPTILSNGQHTSGGSWTWTVSTTGAAGNAIVSTTAQKPPYSALSVSGTPYTDAAGTRGLSFGMDQLFNYVQAELTPTQDHVTIRYNIRVGTLAGTFQTVDGPTILTTAGGYFVLQMNSSFQAQAHADLAAGGSQTSASTRNDCINPAGGTYALTADTWYQVVMDYVRADISTVYIYDAAGTTLLKTLKIDMGVSACDASPGAADSPAQYIRIGRTDAHGGANPPSTSRIMIDGVAVSLSGGTVGP